MLSRFASQEWYLFHNTHKFASSHRISVVLFFHAQSDQFDQLISFILLFISTFFAAFVCHTNFFL